MSIIDRLRSLRTAADYGTGIADIEGELASAKARLNALEASREEAIFGEGSIDQVNADIVVARDAIATLEAALTGARKRQAEAAECEHRAIVEETMRRAPALVAEGIELRKELHPLLLEVTRIVKRLREGSSELKQLNTFARQNHRPDLVAEIPMAEWHETLRLARIEESLAKQRAAGVSEQNLRVPDNLGPSNLVDMPFPERGSDGIAGGLNIPGYYPPRVEGDRRAHWMEIVFPELRHQGTPGDGATGGGVLRSIAGTIGGRRKAS